MFPLSIPLVFSFYLLFIMHLLDVKKNYYKLKILFNGLLVLLLGQQMLAFCQFFY